MTNDLFKIINGKIKALLLIKYCIVALLVLFTACESSKQQEPVTKSLTRTLDTAMVLNTIAFGSCNKQNKPQSIWADVIKNQPDMWVWLGDNVYADTTDSLALEQCYHSQKSNGQYQQLLNTCPVIGIWDDHDYGINDGGKEHPTKAMSKNALFDFLDVPRADKARKREGAYQSYLFGEDTQKVKVILLDTRYFRDELVPNPSKKPRYQRNEQGDILGAAQWAWLKQELKNSDAAIHLIASSIQVIAEEHYFEKWANFPKARQRLLALLEQTRPKRPILLSGDRHIGEIAKIELAQLPSPLYEITSSGLTHAYTNYSGEPNRHRVGKVVAQRNFGIVKIDWEDFVVTAELRGIDNQVLLTQQLY